MPAVTFNLYDRYRMKSQDGTGVNVETPGGNGIKCAIVATGYTPDQDADDFFDDVTNEVTGTNYTAGGNVMSNGSVSLPDAGTGLVTVDIDDPGTWLFDASGFTNGRRAIIYLDTGTAATSTLIGFSNDFGSDQGNGNGDFNVTVNASGLYTMPR